VEFSSAGLRVNGSLQHKWSGFGSIDVFDDGILLNVDRRRSLWLAYAALEEGTWSAAVAFIERIGRPCKLVRLPTGGSASAG
jgi:hypothetical protein